MDLIRIESVFDISRQLFRQNIFSKKIENSILKNPWFTNFYIKTAFKNIQFWFSDSSQNELLKQYPTITSTKSQKTVGIITAGNIPFVGFHDFLMSLLSGYNIQIKLSRQDNILMEYVINFYKKNLPKSPQSIEIVSEFNKIDFLLATGSNNTNRFFEANFKNTKKILRQNRHSVAVLNGNESNEQLKQLSSDVFLYNGLGCRNVSTVFMPKNYDTEILTTIFDEYDEFLLSDNYKQKVHWLKAYFKTTEENVIISKNCVLKLSNFPMQTELGIINLVEYSNDLQLQTLLKSIEHEIQCIVSEENVTFGESQKPNLLEFADGVDTLAFLLE